MNSVHLIGRMAADPEVKFTPTKKAFCNFSIAIDRDTRNGEEKKTDFPRIVVFGKQAENCGKFTAKGLRVGIQGRLETNGPYTNVIADRVEFLEWKPKDEDPIPEGFGDIDF